MTTTTLPGMTLEQARVFWAIATYVVLISSFAMIVGAAAGVVLFFLKGARRVETPETDVVSIEQRRAQLDAVLQSRADSPPVSQLSRRNSGVAPPRHHSTSSFTK